MNIPLKDAIIIDTMKAGILTALLVLPCGKARALTACGKEILRAQAIRDSMNTGPAHHGAHFNDAHLPQSSSLTRTTH